MPSLPRRFTHVCSALAMLVGTSGMAAETVSIQLTKDYAYEADPTNSYGEFKIIRTAAKSTPLAVNVFVTVTTPAPLNPEPTVDYRIDYVPGTASTGNINTFQVTIPANQTEVSARVIPLPDADQVTGELNEWVSMQVLSDNNNGQTYSVSDTQAKRVYIVDANITAQMVTKTNAAEKLTLPLAVANGNIGNIQCLFANGSVRNANPIRSFSPYARYTIGAGGTFVARQKIFS